MHKICEFCLEQFETNRRKRRFCSNKCSVNFTCKRKFPIKLSDCKHCQKQFQITSDNKVFCSQSCYFLSKARKFTCTICKTCKKEFNHNDWNSHTFTYCSNECKYSRGNGVKYRKKALETYGSKCSVCIESKGRIEVHHIDYDRSNNDISNLQVLCHGCHLRIHALIKRSGLAPRFCMDLLLNTDIFKLKPRKFVRLWKDASKGKISFSNDMDLFSYIP